METVQTDQMTDFFMKIESIINQKKEVSKELSSVNKAIKELKNPLEEKKAALEKQRFRLDSMIKNFADLEEVKLGDNLYVKIAKDLKIMFSSYSPGFQRDVVVLSVDEVEKLLTWYQSIKSQIIKLNELNKEASN